jgi:iron complex transport system ATP-binding protein
MTLAQETRVLLLDEPTTYLDMSHQLEVMHLLRDLNADGATVVLVVHDLNLAARYAHHMVAIANGSVACAGSPSDVMTEQMLRDVFSVKADIVRDARLGVPLCLPHDVC